MNAGGMVGNPGDCELSRKICLTELGSTCCAAVQSWSAMASHGGLQPEIASHGKLWLAMVGNGWSGLASVGVEWNAFLLGNCFRKNSL